MTSPNLLQERLTLLQHQIQSLATQPVTLIAVTKYASLEQMIQLYAHDVRHFGENKVQDALSKKDTLPAEASQNVTWHLIGHLQSNKVNKAVGAFDWIHSVDSLALAEKINRRADELGIIQKVLFQINISGEESKEGFSQATFQEALPSLLKLRNIHAGGLMTITPANAPDDERKQIFSELAVLRLESEKLALSASNEWTQSPMQELSMGMSHDYPQALSCGATMIRVGQFLIQAIPLDSDPDKI